MKIVICGSLQFVSEMKSVQNQLTSLGHTVFMPESAKEEKDKSHWQTLRTENEAEFARIKGERILLHFSKIDKADAIIVLNYKKKGKANYIGANTFLEMGYAFGVGKKIFTLNPLPKEQGNYEEIIAMQPVVLDNELERIN